MKVSSNETSCELFELDTALLVSAHIDQKVIDKDSRGGTLCTWQVETGSGLELAELFIVVEVAMAAGVVGLGLVMGRLVSLGVAVVSGWRERLPPLSVSGLVLCKRKTIVFGNKLVPNAFPLGRLAGEGRGSWKWRNLKI